MFDLLILSGAKRRKDTLPALLDSVGNAPYTVVKDVAYPMANIKQRMAFAYSHSLKLADPAKDTLVLEDDFLFTDLQWQTKLTNHINTLSGKFVVALWSTEKGRVGGVALYYSKGLAKELAAFIDNKHKCRTAHDLLLQAFLKIHNIPLHIFKLGEHNGYANSTWHTGLGLVPPK
jgi:hypothetical protein